jgi:hypothetical protein
MSFLSLWWSLAGADYKKKNTQKSRAHVSLLKGRCHEISDFRFFKINFPQAPEYTVRAVPNFFENSWRYSQLNVCHRCSWHRRQMKKSSIRKLLINFIEYLCVVELTYRSIFYFKFTLRSRQSDIVFIICHRCRWYQWCTFTLEYFRECSKKIEMTLTLFSGAWGKMIHEKNLKQKISWLCLFKLFYYLRKSTFWLGGSAKRLEL